MISDRHISLPACDKHGKHAIEAVISTRRSSRETRKYCNNPSCGHLFEQRDLLVAQLMLKSTYHTEFAPNFVGEVAKREHTCYRTWDGLIAEQRRRLRYAPAKATLESVVL